MSNNDEDLSTFLMGYGFTEDELFAVTYELNSFRSIPGTTVKRYLSRVLQTINEDPIFRINIPQRNTFRTPVPSTLKSI